MAQGEEARLTPEGPTAAVIVSRGPLPLRVRTAARGVHHGPPIPGSAVLLGDQHYEVVAATTEGGATTYRLEAWPADQVIRTQVEYGAELVRAAQDDRARGARARRARPWAWLLSPVVGLLPEARQLRACDRWGLDPGLATLASGVAEAMVVLLALNMLVARGGEGALVLGGALGLLLLPVGAFGALRALGALAFGEVTGCAILEALSRMLPGASARRAAGRLTRLEFWRLLERPDRQTRLASPGWLVESALPHLTWTPGMHVRSGGSWWRVRPLPTRVEGAQPVFVYEAEPADPTGPPDARLDPRAYQDEVWAGVAREWQDLRDSGFDVVLSMLPRAPQQRAVGRAGGPVALSGATLVSILLTLLAAWWFETGQGPLNAATGLLLAGDASWRLYRWGKREYAPSLLGLPLARYLRPERVAYRAHRDAAASWSPPGDRDMLGRERERDEP